MDPKPKAAMTTAAGVAHRLTWADRHAGYRMRCSCGWADSTRLPTESAAINSGNNHILSIQRSEDARQKAALDAARAARSATPTPVQRRKETRMGCVAALVLLVVVGAIATGIGIWVYHTFNNPYQDGYNYAQRYDTGGVFNNAGPFPGCSEYAMVNYAHDPNDNYGQWRAGCVSNAPTVNGAADPNFSGNSGNSGNTGNSG